MVNYDFSPLFRSTVGFDRLSRLLESNLAKTETAYPPYNIAKSGENAYRITFAVAGFGERVACGRTYAQALRRGGGGARGAGETGGRPRGRAAGR